MRRLLALRRAPLQTLHERLDVRVRLHRQAHLVLVLAGGLLQLGDVHRHAHHQLQLAQQRQRRLRDWRPRRRSGERSPTRSPKAGPLVRTWRAAPPRSRLDPRSCSLSSPTARSSRRRRRSPSSPPAGSGERRPAGPRASPRAARRAPRRGPRSAQLNERQRIEGSAPCTITRSRGARGARASRISTDGQEITRAWVSSICTWGRLAWKS